MSKPSRLCKSRSYWDWLYLYLGLGLFQDRIEIARAGFHYAADSSKLGGGYLHAVGLVFEHRQERRCAFQLLRRVDHNIDELSRRGVIFIRCHRGHLSITKDWMMVAPRNVRWEASTPVVTLWELYVNYPNGRCPSVR